MTADVDSQKSDSILLACTTGDVETLDRLLANSANDLSRLEELAHTAIRNDQPAILRRLFAIPDSKIVQVQGINITAYLSFNAICRESPECLQVLLDNGLNPNHVLDHTGDLVQHAVLYRHIASLETLLIAGADPQYPYHGYLPAIAVAAGAGQQDYVALLMRHGVKLRNSMAIHNAAAGSTVDMVAWLLDSGADINEYPVESDVTWMCKDEWGSPLHWAAQAKNWDVIEFLLAKGADTNIKDEKKRSVLESGGNAEVLRRLLEKYSKKVT